MRNKEKDRLFGAGAAWLARNVDIITVENVAVRMLAELCDAPEHYVMQAAYSVRQLIADSPIADSPIADSPIADSPIGDSVKRCDSR